MTVLSYKNKKDFSENEEIFLWIPRGHNRVEGSPLPFKATSFEKAELNLVLADETRQSPGAVGEDRHTYCQNT